LYIKVTIQIIIKRAIIAEMTKIITSIEFIVAATSFCPSFDIRYSANLRFASGNSTNAVNSVGHLANACVPKMSIKRHETRETNSPEKNKSKFLRAYARSIYRSRLCLSAKGG
jgi:hypothetical protein